MAGLQGSFPVGATSCVGAAAQTLLQIVAPANQRLKITGVEISFDGTNSANTPAEVKLEKQTTAGTFTNTAVAPKKVNEKSGVGETLQAVGQTVCTAEPTEGDILDQFSVPVFGGSLFLPFPPGQELIIAGGERFGVKVLAAQTVNARLTVKYEE